MLALLKTQIDAHCLTASGMQAITAVAAVSFPFQHSCGNRGDVTLSMKYNLLSARRLRGCISHRMCRRPHNAGTGSMSSRKWSCRMQKDADISCGPRLHAASACCLMNSAWASNGLLAVINGC